LLITFTSFPLLTHPGAHVPAQSTRLAFELFDSGFGIAPFVEYYSNVLQIARNEENLIN